MLALAGCGQTGPLYLPEEATPVIIREGDRPEGNGREGGAAGAPRSAETPAPTSQPRR
jgi:hypothetical protein